MTVEALVPMLRCADIGTMVRFYCQTLGFRIDGGDEALGWVSLARDDVSIMLSRLSEHEGDQRPHFTGSLYFRVDDVDTRWLLLCERATVCYPIEDFPYGMREFGIYDPEGYLLQFGQPIRS
ncbi:MULTISPECIES: VOC family protein [Dyella]|uniref:VOC family protein n=2 Tax=Dyella TaxID=231454 RepID=A0A4R0YXH6_9GAMM|nr:MULTISPECIES: VOC family protein [Dyella]TBR40349.1 VOC family protein [Dyella terrae]TCI12069.1 VOC family protein [Dyella soli]